MKNKILFTLFGLLAGLAIGISAVVLIRKPEKVYVIIPDLLKTDIDNNLWRIGDKEFWNTQRGVEQDYKGHVIFTFEFTSRDILMPPK